MIDNQKGAPTEEVFPELTRDVIDRMSNAKSARLQEVMEVVIRHLHAIVRESKKGRRASSRATTGSVLPSSSLTESGMNDTVAVQRGLQGRSTLK
jgi:hypothetical protein